MLLAEWTGGTLDDKPGPALAFCALRAAACLAAMRSCHLGVDEGLHAWAAAGQAAVPITKDTLPAKSAVASQSADTAVGSHVQLHSQRLEQLEVCVSNNRDFFCRTASPSWQCSEWL